MQLSKLTTELADSTERCQIPRRLFRWGQVRGSHVAHPRHIQILF
jgi:hypothetical protein